MVFVSDVYLSEFKFVCLWMRYFVDGGITNCFFICSKLDASLS